MEMTFHKFVKVKGSFLFLNKKKGRLSHARTYISSNTEVKIAGNRVFIFEFCMYKGEWA
jgi:hypothetical protein